LAAWAGLGYYARARNLVKCARVIAAEYHGEFPQNEQALRALPGIGDYTAAAIAAIAFGERAVVVDANVERVVARLFMIDAPLPNARKFIRAKTDSITPQSRSGDFAQAMMDLGSSLCRAKDAQCKTCPLIDDCLAGQNGKALNFPVKKPKAAKPIRQGKAYWIEKDGAVWLVKRSDKGMLGGMRALPDNGWRAGSDGDMPPPITGPWSISGESVIHHFTHFTVHLQLHVYDGPTDNIKLPNVDQNGEWWPVDRLDDAGLPTLFAKAAFIGTKEYKRLI
jgi:A/G-specific adenine glycosylase